VFESSVVFLPKATGKAWFCYLRDLPFHLNIFLHPILIHHVQNANLFSPDFYFRVWADDSFLYLTQPPILSVRSFLSLQHSKMCTYFLPMYFFSFFSHNSYFISVFCFSHLNWKMYQTKHIYIFHKFRITYLWLCPYIYMYTYKVSYNLLIWVKSTDYSHNGPFPRTMSL
jgi:hypothetical protein